MNITSWACELPARRWGVGNPRSALLVHGIAASGAGWSGVASRLAGAGFCVTAPDLRGHGSAPATETYRFEEFAADLEQLGTTWDVVVGHSFAGPIVATLLRSGMVAVRGAVLVDPLFEVAVADLGELVADQMTEADPFADPRAIATANPGWGADDAFHKAAAARAVNGHTIERAFLDNAPWDHAGLLAGLPVPVHILGADPTVFTLFPPDLALRVSAAADRVTYEVVAGAGHSIHRERPEVVVAAALAAAGAPA